MGKKSFIRNKLFKVTIIVFLILFLVSGGVYVYLLYVPGKEIEIVEEEKDIDDRISPLTNQAVFLEINRVRKKGIIDHMLYSGALGNFFKSTDYQIDSNMDFLKLKMLTALDGIRPTLKWRETPQFSWYVTLDGYTYHLPAIYDRISWQSFETWDTGYIDQVWFKNVTDENVTTTVIVDIVEPNENQGLFNRFNTDESKIFPGGEKKVLSLEFDYNFKTGRWSGDDSFNDSDGYGHCNESDYEVWFSITQTTADGDEIPWWVETNMLNSSNEVDDSKQDPDNDGVNTEWEWKWGYDPYTWENHSSLDPDHDGIQNIEECMISEWLSNPFYPEMYIECDWMDQTPWKPFNINWHSADGWTHEFYEESQQMIIERFNEHGISVHIDDGCMGGGGDIIPFDKAGSEFPFGNFIQGDGKPAEIYAKYFTEERKGIFRYVAICYKGGWCHPQDSRHCYDCVFVPHNRKFSLKTNGFAATDRTERIGLAEEIFHELGHSCGFTGNYSEGVDSKSFVIGTSSDYPWWEYVSAMNYDYYWFRYLDYSDGSHGPNDTDDWGNLNLAFFQESSMSMEGIEGP
jgi:hypothetical protein